MKDYTGKTITMKIANEEHGHATVQLDVPAAISRITAELNADKWLYVEPCTDKDRYPVVGARQFAAQQDVIVDDMIAAQSIEIMTRVTGG